MPFKSKERLEQLIETAFKDREIHSAFLNANVPIESLKRLIYINEDHVWSVAINEIENYDYTESRIKFLNKELETYDFHAKKEKLSKHFLFRSAITLFIIGNLIAFSAIYFSNKLVRIYQTINASITNQFLVLGGILIILYFLYRFLRYALKIRRESRIFSYQSNKIDRILIDSTIAEKRITLESLAKDLISIEKTAETYILEKSIKEILREELNKKGTPSYSVTLPEINAPGLAEVFDPSRAIDTNAKRDLDFLFKNMPGGSIGIAGPRGAGKSTLIKTYCGDNRIINEINGKNILSIMTTAPVQYHPRDFILHLFSKTCSNFLKMQNVPPETTEIFLKDKYNASLRREAIINLIQSLSRLLFILGLFFIYLSIGLLFFLTKYPKVAQESANSSIFVRLIHSLNLNPGSLLIWGIFFIFIWFLAIRRKAMFRILYSNRMAANYHQGASQIPNLGEHNATTERLIRLAQKWLNQIKFQQSFTTGWSGSIKFPIGIEGGLNRANTFAENQLSSPDIIAGFTDFLAALPPEFITLIGIDELDKIDTDEHAQTFLNEIKSVFGLPRCFFLISVSENAISSFERRGLPFRDVFDSSFDHIVYVDYMSLNEAESLLQRRVIGKPMPFFGLSYCNSGGLPRDLIRNFREIVKLSTRQLESKHIYAICKELLNLEFASKVRAISFSAKKVHFLPETDGFFTILNKMNSNTLSDKMSRSNIRLLLNWKLSINSKINQEYRLSEYQMLFNLCEELCAYTYFVDTLLELFHENLTTESFKIMSSTGTLEKVAKARQAMALDPLISTSIISDLRTSNGMTAYHSILA